MKIVYWTLSILAVVALIAAGAYTYRIEAMVGPFRSHVDEYLGFKNLPPLVSDDPLVGRVIVVKLDTNTIDTEVFTHLPARIRASDPSDVDFVVFTQWVKEEIGSYTNGAPAYQYSCDVRIVDLRAHATRRRFGVVGAEPPQKITNSEIRRGQNAGDRPIDEIARRITYCFDQPSGV